MRAGWLRHRITIQDKSVTQNSYGEEVITWTDVATVWGSVEPLRGREFVEVARDTAEITTRIRLRYRKGIYPSMRCVWNDGNGDQHVYDVMSVQRPFERNKEIELMCRENVED